MSTLLLGQVAAIPAESHSVPGITLLSYKTFCFPKLINLPLGACFLRCLCARHRSIPIFSDQASNTHLVIRPVLEGLPGLKDLGMLDHLSIALQHWHCRLSPSLALSSRVYALILVAVIL